MPSSTYDIRVFIIQSGPSAPIRFLVQTVQLDQCSTNAGFLCVFFYYPTEKVAFVQEKLCGNIKISSLDWHVLIVEPLSWERIFYFKDLCYTRSTRRDLDVTFWLLLKSQAWDLVDSALWSQREWIAPPTQRFGLLKVNIKSVRFQLKTSCDHYEHFSLWLSR